MSKEIRILSPCGMLGYGFPIESLQAGMKKNPNAIVVDAGSTDAGPHKLGAGVGIVSKRAVKRDLGLLIEASLNNKVPLIIGSAGGAGARPHVEWTLDIIHEFLSEKKAKPKMAVIWADFEKDSVKIALKDGRIVKMNPNVPELSVSSISETHSIVAQMGHEQIVEALQQQCEIIVCGRAFDPSPFAAVGIYHGMDAGLSYHLGKILECGALCAEPGTTKDCIIGTIKKDSFTVQATNPQRKCSTISVAAHTFYEKDHPYLLQGPGFLLDLSQCEFIEADEGVVEVSKSKFIPSNDYYVKLEGARKTAYRTIVIAGIRDPVLIKSIEDIEEIVKEEVILHYNDISKDTYKINFYNYGKNGVLGEKETEFFSGYEIGLVFEVVADTQEIASSICASVRSTFLHYGYEGRKSTAGNLAFPFAPSDIDFGPVYEFSIYHLMKLNKGEMPFHLEVI
ncbi:acyclic terpene utilization AtuA family protein [Metabacillus idriensis]|uniref:acyclic terpene utilization AtuA family protein n=1 Tax=Metabacillus idriensis TaxID=324768 RepID=UPI0017497098|nr:acyclic terpene utilization AtuA family protein [Metabacillus idriensis]